MRFYQNTVPLQGDQTPSLEEFAAKILNKTAESEEIVKTASAEEIVKTAEKEEKEECETTDAGKAEAELASQGEDKSEDKDCYAEGEAKVEKEAEWNFEKGDKKDDDDDSDDDDSDDDKSEDDEDKSEDDDKDAKCAEGEAKVEKTAEEDKKDEKGEQSSGQLEVEPLHQKGESEEASKVNDDNKKEATVSSRLVKISKLDAKTKNMLVEYYKMYYPAEYVEALVKEK